MTGTNPDGTMEDALARCSNELSAALRRVQSIETHVGIKHALAVEMATIYDQNGNSAGADVWTGRYIELAAVLRFIRREPEPDTVEG